MKRFLSPYVVLVFGLLLCFGPAKASRPARDLEKELNSIRSMTADFTQTVRSQRGKTLQIVRGNLRLWRPGRFRWEIRTPGRQTIVADGKSLYEYDRDLKQVTVKSLRKVWGTPALFLSGSLRGLGRYFDVSKRRGQYILVAKANKKNDFKRIVLSIQGGRLLSMQMIDRLGQSSKIQFSRIRINVSIDPEFFRFTIPKGVDVL